MKNLRMFKLITGEEIVAEVIGGGSDDFRWIIKNALLLMLGATEKGIGLNLFPWGNHTADGEITIYEEHIIYSSEPRQELVERYEQAFSPLTLPQKNLLVG